MIIDIILIAILAIMLLYGYKKGLVKIIAKLVSLIVALVLAYLLADTVGDYILKTSIGQNVEAKINLITVESLGSSESTSIVSALKQQLSENGEKIITDKITKYVFTSIGFITVWIVVRIVLWIVQKIIETIFEAPVLKTFNKLGGAIVSGILCIIEMSIILGIIKSASMLPFMEQIVNYIESSVITKTIYDHNILVGIIISKII